MPRLSKYRVPPPPKGEVRTNRQFPRKRFCSVCPTLVPLPKYRINLLIKKLQEVICYTIPKSMSGHSKWSTIKRQKESTDAKRGILFSKLARAISIAARDSADSDTNFKLRLVIDKARTANMPKENIERALRAAQEKATQVEKVIYEGYGPGGIAVIVEAATDNRNRTSQEIRGLFERGGGSLAGPGSVAFQFKEMGQIIIDKTQNPQDQMLTLIDSSVTDIEESEDGIEVFVSPPQIPEVRDKIAQLGYTIKKVELTMKAKNAVKIVEAQNAQKILALLESLESHEDVQEVFSNVDIVG